MVRMENHTIEKKTHIPFLLALPYSRDLEKMLLEKCIKKSITLYREHPWNQQPRFAMVYEVFNEAHNCKIREGADADFGQNLEPSSHLKPRKSATSSLLLSLSKQSFLPLSSPLLTLSRTEIGDFSHGSKYYRRKRNGRGHLIAT